MAAFYADENFPLAVVELLRALGHDILTVQEAGQQGKDDAAVLSHATSLQRAVLTLNRRHFIALHARHSTHAGIVVCTLDQSEPLSERIHQAVAALPDLSSQLIRINRPTSNPKKQP